MENMEQWWQYQQSLWQLWTDACSKETGHEWLSWVPIITMGGQTHGLSNEQRDYVDTIADKYIETLQKMFELTLQHLSLYSEMVERFMHMMQKCTGVMSVK